MTQIDYELACSLRDAGFPQGTTTDANKYTHLDYMGNPCGPLATGAVYLPTLSELIEACGGKFEYLNRVHGKIDSWFAGTQDDYAGTERSIFQGEGGSTPEEAVAKLYLALHEKKD